MTHAHTPWAVVASPTDPEMYAVQGAYLVADNLPIEDARLIAAAPDLLAALGAIAEATSAEDDAGENYRWDDREGALDYAYATAAEAIAKVQVPA